MQFLNSHIDMLFNWPVYYNSIIEFLTFSYWLLILVCHPKIFSGYPYVKCLGVPLITCLQFPRTEPNSPLGFRKPVSIWLLLDCSG